MDNRVEGRLLVGDLIARSMDVGISKVELMQIVIGTPTDVSLLLDELWASEAVERRVRHLREVLMIASSICGTETGPWLRAVNPALGQRSPIETLLTYPDALAGMMHLLRRLDSDLDTIH